MCGIAGYIGHAPLPEPLLEECLTVMKRRGPDAAGVFSETTETHTVHLLHTRLSIIDLDERSNQPMQSPPLVLTYNGELYNFVELRRELEASGAILSTNSDTEVLLESLRVHGVDGLRRCDGMWAFALYDRDNGTLMLSRDRFGEKPLYYFRSSDGVYFGSEIKFIQALLGSTPLDIDLEQCVRFLINGYRSIYHARSSFFSNVNSVPPGTTISIENQSVTSPTLFWAPDVTVDETMRYGDAVGETREILIRTMKRRLRADIPIAFCMSGGVDSNSLIAIAKRHLGYDVHGFTVDVSDERYAEDHEVQAAVRELGIRHTRIRLSAENSLEQLRTLVRYHDAPIYTISYYAHWLLLEQIAAHGYRVSISGTGADELFTGYYDHHLLFLHQMRNDANYDGLVEAWETRVRPEIRNPFLQNKDLYAEYGPNFRGHILLNANRFREFLNEQWEEPLGDTSLHPDLLRSRMLNELRYESVPVILHEDDLNSMYHSVENRSPFLSEELYRHAYRIPTRHLIRDGYAKSVLREAMKGIVPDDIILNRRKVGFNAPIQSFVDFHEPGTREWMQEESRIYQLVDRDRLMYFLNRDKFTNSESKFLFNFICLKLFLEEWE